MNPSGGVGFPYYRETSYAGATEPVGQSRVLAVAARTFSIVTPQATRQIEIPATRTLVPAYEYQPKGTDLIAEMIDYAQAFCQACKRGEIDPAKTHLAYFTKAVEENFNALFPKDSNNRDIDSFRKEMNDRISRGQVTYEWWLAFNMRLSVLATPPVYRSGWAGSYLDKEMGAWVQSGGWKNHEETVPVIEQYLEPQDYCLLPTHLGDLKIHDMNRMFASGAFAIGLSNKPLMVDGRLMWPDQFFRHDLVHFRNERRFMDEEPPGDFIPVRERFFQMRESLHSDHLVKLMDFVFFYMSHEIVSVRNMKNYFKSPPTRPFKREFIFNENTFDYMKRSDWYVDHVPKPQELGFQSMRQMLTFGVKVLDIFLNHETTLESLPSAIEEVAEKCREEEVRESESTTVVIPANLDCQNRDEVILNAQELAVYNEIARDITLNGKASLEVPESTSLQKLLLMQGMVKLIQ